MDFGSPHAVALVRLGSSWQATVGDAIDVGFSGAATWEQAFYEAARRAWQVVGRHDDVPAATFWVQVPHAAGVLALVVGPGALFARGRGVSAADAIRAAHRAAGGPTATTSPPTVAPVPAAVPDVYPPIAISAS